MDLDDVIKDVFDENDFVIVGKGILIMYIGFVMFIIELMIGVVSIG